MNSYRRELWFEVPTRRAFINITPQVESCLRDSGIKEGLALVNAMHITASVFINDNESGLHHDYKQWLEQPFIRFDLPLQLFVLLRSESRLSLVRNDLINVQLGPIGAKHRPP